MCSVGGLVCLHHGGGEAAAVGDGVAVGAGPVPDDAPMDVKRLPGLGAVLG